MIGTSTSAEGAAGSRLNPPRPDSGRGAVLDVGDGASIDALIADLDAGEMPTLLINNAAITCDTLLPREQTTGIA